MKTKSECPAAGDGVDVSCFRRSFLETLARWWWAELLLLLVLPIALCLLAGAVSGNKPKLYESSALIEILSPGERSDVFRDGPPDSRLTPEFLATQCEIIRSSGCLAKVVTSLKLPKQWQLPDVEQVMARLKSRLRTQVLPGTRLVRVTVWSPKSEEARHLAMEVVRAYRETRQLDSENASRAELDDFQSRTRYQEDSVEGGRRELVRMMRLMGISYQHGPDPPITPEEVQPKKTITMQTVNRFDYSDTKRDYEMNIDILMWMKRELAERYVRIAMPNPVCIIREEPVAASKPARPDVPRIMKKAAGGGLLLALLLVIPLACLLEGFGLCRRRKRSMAQVDTVATPPAEKGA
ncbi:MAG: hypothetical protein K9N23_19735 [Akkermansiaceae bacterium]|nr:hypothetical protein [Akkermansiaceae bacterium]